jgi:hypothetical protein
MAEVAAKEAGDTHRTKLQTDSAERINDANNKAGRWDKVGRGGINITQNLMSGKMKVPERLGTVRSILDSGINPDTEQPLSAMERVYLTSMYDQDAATTEGRLALQGQGVTAKANAAGEIKIVNKDKPSVRTGNTPPEQPTRKPLGSY